MTIDERTLARARLVLDQATAQYLYDPNVNLIDFGYPEHGGEIVEDELAIRFHVRQKLSGVRLEMAAAAGETRPIPPSIGEFQTDVPEGRYRLHQWPWSWGWRRRASETRARRLDPLRGGISISNEGQNGYGTLGGIVRDRQTGENMCLSNYHVLANTNSPWRRLRIYQPGRLDNGTTADTIGRYWRDAMAANLDAAVASLSDDRAWSDEQEGLGPVGGATRPELGMEVTKSGRRTGVTYGRVTAVEGTAKLPYGRTDRLIRHVFTIEPRQASQEVSGPGDSGSWWLDTATSDAVGLHFAGANVPERALAIEMLVVLDALDVDLVACAQPGGSLSHWTAGWH